MAHKLVACWNTGNRYTAKGQRITAALTQDNHIIFKDHDRGISGVIQHASIPLRFESSDLKMSIELQNEVTRSYNKNEYMYDVTGQADKLKVYSSDPMHGGGPGKSGKV